MVAGNDSLASPNCNNYHSAASWYDKPLVAPAKAARKTLLRGKKATLAATGGGLHGEDSGDVMTFKLEPDQLIEQLAANAAVFETRLSGLPESQFRWKPSPADWCLLEVVCHLYDEERDDFRARLQSTLDDPAEAWPPNDPQDWVLSHKYLEQDYALRVQNFLQERADSIAWLRGLDRPAWDNEYAHAVLGRFTARSILENWLAHDYLHLRQINRRMYGFLAAHAVDALRYAGDW